MKILLSNKKLNCLIGFFLILNSVVSVAQNTGIVKFQIDNENGYFEILLDDTLLIKHYKDTLPAGYHRAKVWSYGYNTKEIEFTVEANTVNEVYVKLDRSAAYMAYEESYSKYRVQFHKAITVPISVSLALTITSGVFMTNAYDLKKSIVLDMGNYNQSTLPDEIAQIKARVEENNRKYNFNRTAYYISGSFALIGIGTSIYTSLKFKKSNSEPTYSKQSPFSDKVSLQFTGSGLAIQLKLG